MTEEEIEREVQARVEFKMGELLTGLRNRAGHSWNAAATSGTPRYSHYWEAFTELAQMVKKEAEMATPSNTMSEDKRREVRDRVIEKLNQRFNPRGKKRHAEEYADLQFIVSRVEEAQRF